MKRTMWFLLASIAILSLTLLPACGQNAQTYTVATDATWPPFEYQDEATQNIIGFDVDLIKAIAAKEGLNLKIMNVSWDPLLAGMTACQYDIAISSMTITDERKQTFNFSNPYFAAGQVVSIQKGNTTINSKDDLGGKRIGVQLGTTGDIEAQKISGATVKSYDNISNAFQDLIDGQVDAVIADNPLAIKYVGQNADKLMIVGDVFTDEYYGIAVCKTRTDLLDKINKGLAAVKQEGLIDELTQKWIISSDQ